MSFTETIKNYILHDCRMDSVGVAPVSALASEDELHSVERILPGAKSIIVFTKRIPDGVIQAAFRRMEDGNRSAQSIYAAFGTDLTPGMELFFMQFNIAEFIERNFGFTAVPVPSGPMQNVTQTNQKMPAFIGPRRVQYLINSERAAMAAGLGEIGWNNLLLTPEHGPRVGIGLVLTMMELDHDSPYSGPRLCDPEKCGICSGVCPMHAIPAADGIYDTPDWSAYYVQSQLSEGKKEIVDTYQVAGKTYGTAHINNNACAVASMAFRKEFSVQGETEDLIMNNDPSDAELSEAYLKKTFIHTSLDHYPKHYCNKCVLYCPVGNWKERYADRGLSNFDGKEYMK